MTMAVILKDRSLLIFTTLTAASSILAMSLSLDGVRQYLWFLYLLQLIGVGHVLLRSLDRWMVLLSPSFICVSYVLLNNFLGSIAFSSERVHYAPDYYAYLSWNYPHLSVVFTLACNWVVVLSLRQALRGVAPRVAPASRMRMPSLEFFSILAFSGIAILFFSFVDLNLSFAGGDGSFSIFPKTLAALVLAVALHKRGSRWRFLCYLLLISYFASFSAEDKRQAIFLFLPIIMIEALNLPSFKISLRFFTVSALAFVLVVFLILMMSIYRGYGQYNPEGFLDSAQYVDDYILEDRFLEYLLANTEVNYLFFHSHQALEYILEDPRQLLWGSTFAKILFIPVPRYLYPDKPKSIIERYTGIHSPEFRALGGSWASGIYAEFFWNFHFLGLIPLYLLFLILNKGYLWLAKYVREGMDLQFVFPIYAYQQLMELFRGTGLDQFFTYCVVSAVIFFAFLYPMLVLILFATRSRTRNLIPAPIGSQANH